MAVAKPSARPSFLPCTTRPLMLYGRPSSSAARSRSPRASASRTAELETRVPPFVTVGIASSSKPWRPASAASDAKSPARFAP